MNQIMRFTSTYTAHVLKKTRPKSPVTRLALHGPSSYGLSVCNLSFYGLALRGFGMYSLT